MQCCVVYRQCSNAYFIFALFLQCVIIGFINVIFSLLHLFYSNLYVPSLICIIVISGIQLLNLIFAIPFCDI